MSTPPPSSSPGPGWFADPSGAPGVQRWWDGTTWTDHTQPAPQPGGGGDRGKGRRGCLIGCGGLLALVLVVGAIASVTGSGGGADPAGGGASSGESDGGGGDEEAPTVGVGESISLEGTRYRVTSAETATELGDEFTRETPDGVFVVVEVELENLKEDTRTISSEALTLVSRDDREYSTSDDALLSVDDQLIFEDIQPGLSTSGTLVYDVPTSATRGARLRVEDLFGGGEGFVRLGLD